jgi:hypothetical protein
LGRRVLDVAGDWIIEIYSDPSAPGAYSFVVITASAPSEASLDVGQPVSDEITAIGEWHRYRMTAAAGDVVYFDATGDCVDGLWWRLLRPDGVLSTFDRTCVDLRRRVLDVAGEWVVEVYSDSTATGPYSFTTIAAPAPTEATITIEQPVSGTIDQVAEWHRFHLTVDAGQVVYLDATDPPCTDGLFWRLIRPDGVLVTFDRTCVDLGRRVLDVAGDWVVEVFSDVNATGPYAFSVLDVPAARQTPLVFGQQVSDTIDEIGEWHRYTLAATAGQTITLDALGTDCVDGLFWRLVRPDGVLVTFDRTCIDMGQRVLDVAGDWVVEVYSDTVATGPYSFVVNSP